MLCLPRRVVVLSPRGGIAISYQQKALTMKNTASTDRSCNETDLTKSPGCGDEMVRDPDDFMKASNHLTKVLWPEIRATVQLDPR